MLVSGRSGCARAPPKSSKWVTRLDGEGQGPTSAYRRAMPLARRQLLSVGAALAISAAAAACSDDAPDARLVEPRGTPAPPSPEAVPPAAERLLFPGQPPPGSLYYGASVPHHRSLPAWEATLGSPLALNRSYFTPDHNETAQLVRRCGEDLRQGRLPHVSTKTWGTWREVAAGVRDEWLTGILSQLGREAGPVFLTLHHEPENDAGPAGMAPTDYVAMQRRAIELAAELAPQVVVVPVLQQWTFDPSRHDIDPSAWIVPEAAVMGLDIYNPWSPTNGKEWRSFGSKADEVIRWFGDRPMAIGEYGCRENPDVPGLAAEWLRDAADYARTHNVVSMSYFNSGVGSQDGSWRLTGSTEEAFAELLAADWVARPG
jgi:hypothetical protein